MGLRIVLLLVASCFTSFAVAQCPPGGCPGKVKARVVQITSGPKWNYYGSGSLESHVRRDHGIDTTGMTPDQIQAAHNAAHGAGRAVSRTVIRSSPRRLFRLFR